MIRSEFFKITRHRTPWVVGGAYSAALLAGPAYLLIKPPADQSTYLEVFSAVFAVVGLLLSAVVGAWFVGNEYRHGTLRRVMAVDARRTRLLATKAGLGLATSVAGLVAVASIGFAGTTLVAGINGDALVTDGLVRELLGVGFIAVVTGVIAFLMSVVLRSDTYAMLTSLGVMIVFGPLATSIPTVGKYTPFAVTSQIAERIQDSSILADPSAISLQAAVGTLAATIALITGVSARLFGTRDV